MNDNEKLAVKTYLEVNDKYKQQVYWYDLARRDFEDDFMGKEEFEKLDAEFSTLIDQQTAARDVLENILSL